METLEALRQRVQSAEDLLAIVKTMKTLAAANIRQYERAAISLAEYNRTVEMSLQVALRHKPEQLEMMALWDRVRDGGLGAVVFGSDQGLCGQFNERIAQYATDTMNGMHIRRQDRRILAVGRRLASHLAARHQPLQAVFATPGSARGIATSVHELLVRIEAWHVEQNVSHIALIYNRTTSEPTYIPQMVQLFPIDHAWLERLGKAPWPSHVLPTILMDWELLFSALVRQYILVALHRAFAESLAGENASRLSAMQAAEHNIQEHLEQFQADYQRLRQQAITDELLDIVGGSAALTGLY